MYVYTDDDLTRINRDYLGPKGRQLPWVATYRTYGVLLGTVIGVYLLFLFLGVPFNKWTVLLYLIVTAFSAIGFTRRLRPDQSLWQMVAMGWQEVVVPRDHRPAPTTHHMAVSVARFDYNATPRPRWWQFRQRRNTPAPQRAAGRGRPSTTTTGRGRASTTPNRPRRSHRH